MSDYDESEYLAEKAEEAKRSFLKEEITELNYDESLFSEFFQFMTEDSDLTEVTFEQLQQIVSDFKNRFRPGQTLEDVQEERRRQEEQERRLYELPAKRKYQLKYMSSSFASINQDLTISRLESDNKQVPMQVKPHAQDMKQTTPPEKENDSDQVQIHQQLQYKQTEIPQGNLQVKEQSSEEKETFSVKKDLENSQDVKLNTLQVEESTNPQEESQVIHQQEDLENQLVSLEETEDLSQTIEESKQNSMKIQERFELAQSYSKFTDYGKDCDSPTGPYRASVPLPIDIESAHSKPKDKSYSINCKKADQTELFLCENLSISLSEPEIVKGGVFSSNYTMYFIKTEPFGWNVRRRYSDFLWLRSTLSKQFPLTCLPPLPPKQTIGRLDSQTIFKRQLTLNRFLQDLACCPLARTSQAMTVFLCDNSLKFKNFVKKVKKPSSISEMITLTGKIKCDMNNQIDHYKNINQYLTLSQDITNKLNKQGTIIVENLSALSSSVQKYAELLKQQARIQQILNETYSCSKLPLNLADTFLEWADFETQKMTRIYEHCKVQSYYFFQECEGLKAFLKEWENSHKKFVRKVAGGAKTDDYYGVLNHNCKGEINRVLENANFQATLNYLNMAKIELESSVNFHHIWSGLFEKLTEYQFSLNLKNK